jgi:hypothetical protein
LNLRTRLSGALVCVVAISLVTAGCASASLLMGVGDESSSTFLNPWFKGLGVKRTRLIAPYNVALASPGALTGWMTGAAFDHEQVVVAFNPAAGSRCPGQPCKAPTASQYTKAFKAFHKAYPSVTIFQPWNEVNSLTQPTSAHPEAVVAYYAIAKKSCPGCTVLGADLEDLKKGPGVPARIDMVNYAKALLKAYRKAHVATPKIWGLHNYVDVNYFTSSGTKAALNTLPGQLWLTETGGIAKFVLSSGKVRLKFDENRQANATTWMMKLALSNKRIARIYIYDMLFNGSATQRFDSSLLGSTGQPRKAYYVLLNHYQKYFS